MGNGISEFWCGCPGSSFICCVNFLYLWTIWHV